MTHATVVLYRGWAASMIALLLGCVSSGPVLGHVQSLGEHFHRTGITYTSIGVYAGGVKLLYTAPLADLKGLAAHGEADSPGSLLDEVAAGFQVLEAAEECQRVASDAVDYAAIEAWQYTFLYRCSAGLEALTIRYQLFAGQPEHVNHIEVTFGPRLLQFTGQRRIDIPVRQFAADSGVTLPEAPPALPGERPQLITYLWLGFDHVLTGWDHLAFVLGLVLLVRRLAVLVGLVTSFTLAHSVTLGLAALEVFVLPRTITEVLIAVSIVYVGAENLWELARGRGRRLPATAVGRRWLTSFAFGLVHGFGFSFLLREVGLPPGQLVSSLALFNVGVELAQLGVVVVPFLLVQRLLRDSRVYSAVAAVLALGIVGLGSYWLFERV